MTANGFERQATLTELGPKDFRKNEATQATHTPRPHPTKKKLLVRINHPHPNSTQIIAVLRFCITKMATLHTLTHPSFAERINSAAWGCLRPEKMKKEPREFTVKFTGQTIHRDQLLSAYSDDEIQFGALVSIPTDVLYISMDFDIINFRFMEDKAWIRRAYMHKLSNIVRTFSQDAVNRLGVKPYINPTIDRYGANGFAIKLAWEIPEEDPRRLVGLALMLEEELLLDIKNVAVAYTCLRGGAHIAITNTGLSLSHNVARDLHKAAFASFCLSYPSFASEMVDIDDTIGKYIFTRTFRQDNYY